MILEKIQIIRGLVPTLGLIPTGFNKTAGFKYFELEDILPKLTELETNNKIFALFSIVAEGPYLQLIDMEDKTEIKFTMQVDNFKAMLQGKRLHPFQELGAASTYYKRYLYAMAYNILDYDQIDADTTISDELYKEINGLLLETQSDLKKLIELVKGEALETLQKKQAYKILEMLKDKQAKMKK